MKAAETVGIKNNGSNNRHKQHHHHHISHHHLSQFFLFNKFFKIPEFKKNREKSSKIRIITLGFSKQQQIQMTIFQETEKKEREKKKYLQRETDGRRKK